MNIQKLIKKYSILLFIYVLLYYLISPYSFKIYYSLIAEPTMIRETYQTFQSILVAMIYLTNLVFMIIIIIDSKEKKTIDWIIILTTLIKADIGILLFLIWQIYKANEIKMLHNKKYT